MKSHQKTADLASGLERLLKDTYKFYLAVHHHHWNVEGSGFVTLHKLFEEQYLASFEAMDEIAERIRMLGFYVHNIHQDVSLESKLAGEDSNAIANEMISHLIKLHESVIESSRTAAELAGEIDDPASEDLCIQRIAAHQKQMWMLSSLLK